MKYFLLVLVFLVACSDDNPANNANNSNNDLPDVGLDAPEDVLVPDVEQDVSDDQDMPVVLPERTIFEQGPLQVAYRRISVNYDAVGWPDRTIPVVIWYPTLDKEGRTSRYANLLNRPEVFRDAAPYVPEPAPVLVFSHGNSSFAEQSYFMTEYFASHGWIVVAPDHTGNTFRDTQGGISFEAGGYRPQDISAALDHIYSLPAEDPLAGKFSDNIVLTGHSFGGYTTLANAGATFDVDNAEALCAEPNAPRACDILSSEDVTAKLREGFLDPRIKVAIPQTPGGYILFQEGIGEIDIPVLLMTAARDATLPDEEEGAPIWAALGPRSMRMDMPNAGHFSYSNMCTVLGFVPEVQNDGCGETFIAPELGFQIMNAFAMAYSRYHLFADDTHLDLLNGSDTRFEEHVDLDFKAQAP